MNTLSEDWPFTYTDAQRVLLDKLSPVCTHWVNDGLLTLVLTGECWLSVERDGSVELVRSRGPRN